LRAQSLYRNKLLGFYGTLYDKVIMSIFWPKKLFSPDIQLCISIEKGMEMLKKLVDAVEERDDKEYSYRVDTPEYDVAIYDKDGIVTSVWFNDPLGRIWSKGKAMKLKLYLARSGKPEDWELRLNNGGMHYHFNDQAGVNMVYGVHIDVIRFNLQQCVQAATNIRLSVYGLKFT